MAIALPDDDKKQALASIERYCAENLDAEVSPLEAAGLLDFFLKEIGPSVYNSGVADAEAFLRDRLADLGGACYEPEFVYWPKSSAVRRK